MAAMGISYRETFTEKIGPIPRYLDVGVDFCGSLSVVIKNVRI